MTDLDFGGSPTRPWPDLNGREAAGARPERAAQGGEIAPARAEDRQGERGISPIAGRFGVGRGGKAVTFAALVAGCGVFLAATWSHGRPHKPKPALEPARSVVDYASTRSAPTLARPGPDAPTLTGAGPDASVPPVSLNPSVGAGAPSAGAAAGLGGDGGGTGATGPAGGDSGPGSARPGGMGGSGAERQAAQAAARLDAIRGAPMLAYNGEARSDGADGSSAEPLARMSERTDGGGGASELDQLRRGSSIGLVRARRLPDRTFLVVAGALLPCTLETAMDTSAPGYVTCRLSRDVYSDNGAVVLMEKGSRVLGEYRSGQQQGRRRIFVLWTRIVTPDGVAVDVASPATDALGRAGFDGVVDTHFWDRFGGALLLSAVGDGLSAVAASNSRYPSLVQAPQEAASVALQNSVNIAPTLRKPQGAEVAIFVSRDLDFSGVYAVKPR